MKTILIIAMVGLFIVGCTHNRGHGGGYHHSSNDMQTMNTSQA